jgi:hypothetical protein
MMLKTAIRGTTGNPCVGQNKWIKMAYLLQLLCPDNQCLDIGSNVDTYTLLATAAIGARVTDAEPTRKPLRA